MRRTMVAGLCVWLASASLPGAVVSAEMRPVKVRMDYLFQGQHAPFFVALDRGYYKEAGLDVELLSGQTSGVGLRTVSSGAEDMGLIDAGVAALGISKGAPVKVVAGYLQKNPTVIVSRRAKPVSSPKDMEGKTIAWPPGAAANFVVQAMMRLNDVDEAKVVKVSTTREAAEALFLEGKVDMAPAFVTAVGLFQSRSGGDELQVLRASDFGVNTLSLAIVANTIFLERHPDTVRAFVGATMRGLHDVVSDPTAGWQTVVKYKPEVDPHLARSGLESSLSLLETEQTKGMPAGWMSDTDWNATLDFLATYMGLSPRLPLDRYFTNDLLPR